MTTSRRDFMKQSTSAIVGTSALGVAPQFLFGAEQKAARRRPTLVVIYLRGGADSLNTIVPFGDPMYYQHRPSIGIPRDAGATSARPLDKFFGFHPSMARLHELYQQGMVAPIINNGGTPREVLIKRDPNAIPGQKRRPKRRRLAKAKPAGGHIKVTFWGNGDMKKLIFAARK